MGEAPGGRADCGVEGGHVEGDSGRGVDDAQDVAGLLAARLALCLHGALVRIALLSAASGRHGLAGDRAWH